jgi:hypothetical protein
MGELPGKESLEGVNSLRRSGFVGVVQTPSEERNNRPRTETMVRW